MSFGEKGGRWSEHPGAEGGRDHRLMVCSGQCGVARVREVFGPRRPRTVKSCLSSLKSRSALLLLLQRSAKNVISANGIARVWHAYPYLLMRGRRSHPSRTANGHALRREEREYQCGCVLSACDGVWRYLLRVRKEGATSGAYRCAEPRPGGVGSTSARLWAARAWQSSTQAANRASGSTH